MLNPPGRGASFPVAPRVSLITPSNQDTMTYSEQKKAAKKFAEYWQGKGYEKGESQPFWLVLLREVFGVAEPEKWIRFINSCEIN